MDRVVTISKDITHGEELVVIPRRQYEEMQKHLTEVRDALGKIRRGERELRTGKTKVVKSLSAI